MFGFEVQGTAGTASSFLEKNMDVRFDDASSSWCNSSPVTAWSAMRSGFRALVSAWHLFGVQGRYIRMYDHLLGHFLCGVEGLEDIKEY